MAKTTIPVELSSTPGITDNSNATAITIDSSEKVGIGTSSPAKLLETVATNAGDDITALQVRNNDSSNATSTSIRFVNSTSGTSTAGGGEISAVRNANDGGALTFKTAADTTATLTESMRIDSSGDIIIGSTSKIYSSGDSDSYLQFNQANTLRAVIGDSTRMIIGTGETVFNEDSGNFDFRVESDDNSNMFVVDAGANQVFVNNNSAGTISNFETKLGTSRHDQSQTATNTIGGSGQPARYANGTQIVESSGDVGTKLIIPMTSQVNLWRPIILKLIGTSAEYNYSAAGTRGFEVCVGFSLLNSINNLTEINRTGNCSSVTADGMNLEFNFTNAYDDGLNSYNGIVFHYEILGITPEYVQVWNASFN